MYNTKYILCYNIAMLNILLLVLRQLGHVYNFFGRHPFSPELGYWPCFICLPLQVYKHFPQE